MNTVIEKRILLQLEEGRSVFFPALERPAALTKLAAELHPQIAQWIARWARNPRFLPVVIAPLGSSEFYGSNSNGDDFPEAMLYPPDGSTWYGYKTFEQAGLFEHHKNEDPTLSAGTIPLSCWNPRMHRVEVVAVYDRERAPQVGCQWIVDKYDHGVFPPYSMGTRVKWDHCSKCGHKATRTEDYCDCLKYMMGTVLPDGTCVRAINYYPRFFDLSGVHVPAAKESGVLMKVAREGTPGFAPRTVKLAEVKTADLDKRIPVQDLRGVSDSVAARQPSIGSDVLRRLSGFPLGSVLGTLGSAGVVLSPNEFSGLLGTPGHSFRWGYDDPTPAMPLSANPVREILAVLGDLLGQRSCLPRPLAIRIQILDSCHTPLMGCVKTASDNSMSAALGSVYSSYRKGLCDLWVRDLPGVLRDHPELLDPDRDLFRSQAFAGFGKLASHKHQFGELAALVSPVYVLSAHLSGNTFGTRESEKTLQEGKSLPGLLQ